MASVPGYGYYKLLYTQEVQISVGTNSLANFPVLVRITDNDLKTVSNGGKVQNTNGFDIVFTSSDGTTLVNQQLEKYNPTTGELVIWVQLPAVSATVNTNFYMYFGNSTVFIDPSTTLTWDSNFKGVWHLNTNLNDATLNGVNLTANSTTTLSPALAADGEEIAPSEYLSYGTNTGLQINGDLTLEAWVNFNSFQTNVSDNFFISNGDVGELGPDNYHYLLNIIGSGVDANKLHVYWEYGAGVDVDVVSTVSVSPSLSVWHHVAVVRDNTNSLILFYFDGLQVGSSVAFTNAPTLGVTSTFRVGEDQNTSTFDIDAGFDEVRVSNSVRIPEWMQATDQSNQTGSTFVIYGATTCVPPDIATVSGNQTVCISIPSTIISGNTPTVGTGAWALVAGTGTIAITASATTLVYGLGSGINIFSWTITSGTCTSVANLTIEVDSPPGAYAGPNQAICILSPSTTLNATPPSFPGVGTWSVTQGTGTITGLSSPNATVTNLGPGANVLQWSVLSGTACAASISTMTIQVDPSNSAALASGNQAICSLTGTTVVTATLSGPGTGSWTTLSGTGLPSSPSSATTNVTGLTTGTTVLKWSVLSGNSCPSNTATLSIQVDPANSPALSSGNQSICISSPTAVVTATLSGPGTGSWTTVSGTGLPSSPSSTITNVTGLTTGTTVLKWSILSGNSCPSNTATLSIQVDPANSPALSSGNQSICISSPTAVVTATLSGPGTGSWTTVSGTGLPSSPSSTITNVTGLTTGTTVLKWSVLSGNSCSSNNATLSIQVDPANSPAQNSGNQIICVSTPTAVITATNPAVGTGTWIPISGTGSISSPGSNTTIVTNLTVGSTVLKWRVQTTNACPSHNSTLTIQVDPLNSPAVITTTNQILCANNATTVLSATPSSTGTGQWSLLSGTATIGNAAAATTSITGLGTGTSVLKWSVNTSNSCPSNSASVSIQADPLNTPAVISTPNQTLCSNNPTTSVAANSVSVGSGGWSVQSGTANIVSAGSATTNVNAIGTGTTILKWSVTSSNSCPGSTATMSVRVDPQNTPAFISTINSTLCSSSPTTVLSATQPTVGNGAWSLQSGTATIVSAANATTNVTGIGIGLSIFKWTISSSNGCLGSTATVSVKVDAMPTTATVAVSSQTICVNTPTATLVGSTPTIGVGTWSLMSGTGTVTSVNNPTTAVTGLTVGTSIFRWKIDNNSSCPASTATTSIKVDQLSSIANAGSNQTLCITGNSGVLSATSPTSGTGTWTLVSGTGTVVTPSSNTSSYSAMALGLNVLKWSVTNGTCPTTTSTMSIEVDNGPATSSAGINQTVCINSASTNMAANTPTAFNGIGTWSLQSGTGTITSIHNASTTVTNLGTGLNVFRWTISNVCGTNSTTMSIQVDQMPTPASAGSNTSVCNQVVAASPSLTLTLSGNTPAVGTGSWTVLTGTATIGNPSAPNTTITSLNVGDNILQWSIKNGVCPVSTSTMDYHVDNFASSPSAGPQQTLCILSPSTTMAAVQPTAGLSSWQLISGTGSIANPTSAVTTVSNLGQGLEIFQWNAFNSGCGNGNTLCYIYVNAAPTTASVSTSNQTICVTSSVTSVSANTSTVSGETSVWSFVQGGGVIANPTLATTAVTLNLGNNVLQWSIGNGGACANSTATVQIWVVGVASTASAGINQTICATTNSTTLAAASPTGGIGNWSVMTGTGTVTTPTLNTSTVTGLAAGLNILKWTLSSPCGASNSSTMSIQVDLAPTTASIITGNQSVCATPGTASLSAVAATVGVGSWSVMSGSGIFTSTSSAVTTVTALTTGTAVVRWKVTNGTCSNTFTRSIVVNTAPSTATTAGNQSVCISSPSTTLTGNTPAIGTGSWTIVGSGSLTAPSQGTSGLVSLTTGTTTLTWKISNGSCPASGSVMKVITYALPGIANAGPNQTVCATTGTAALAATSPTSGTGAWTVVSGSGTLTTPSSPTSIISGLTTGTTTLQWKITNGACFSATTMVIQVDGPPTPATTAGNQSVCITTASTTLTGSPPAIGTGSWTIISGSGVVANPTLGVSTLTALTTGTTVLQWTTINGVCTSNSPTLNVVTFDIPGIPFAGADQTVCASTGSVVLAASNPTSGAGSWSLVSGSGTVTAPALASSSIIGLISATTTLQWIITNGACSAADTMAIQIDSPPTTASAGANQTICITTPSTSLNANSPSIGTGSWSVSSGTGSVTNPNSAGSAVTGMSVGTTVVNWEISNGSCLSSISSVSIEVSDVPSISNAGGNQVMCSSTPAATLAANSPSLGVGLWTIVSGGGTIISPTLATSTATGLVSGTHVLQWALINGACSNTSTMSIEVDSIPDQSDAGVSQYICYTNPSVTLNGNVPSIGSGLWSVVSGTASIVNPTLASSSATALGLGTNVLQWAISNGVCAASVSNVTLVVTNLSVPANAGGDQTICISSPSTTLAANTPSAGIGTWSVLTGGGSITYSNSAGSTVTNLSVGSNLLEWTLSGGGCSNSDTMMIQVDQVPDLSNAGTNQALCISSPSTMLAANVPVSGSGQWSIISGGGLIANVTQYNSSVINLNPGANILEWTISNGACASSSSTVLLQVDTGTIIANAGLDQTICVSSLSLTLGASSPTLGTGTWTLLPGGTGAVTNPTLASSTFTGVVSGTDLLQWTVTNGGCSNSDTMMIQVDATPDGSNAGTSQTLCISSPSAVLAANTPSLGIGTWTVLTGGGTVTALNSPGSNVTGLSLGSNILQWTVSNGICASNVSTVNLQVDNLAQQAFAGLDQTVCVSTASAVLAANTPSVGFGTWTVISGTGTITIPSLAGSNATNLGLNINLLEWTISDGGCFSADTMLIQVDNTPDISNAGSSQSICVNSPSLILGANSPNPGIGTWAVLSGTGTVANLNSPTSAFTGLSTGNNSLQWTVSNGICTSNTSTVDVFVSNLGTPANAGGDQIICVSTGSVLLSGNTPTLGTGSWSVLAGSSTVSVPGSPTSPVNGLSVGSNILEWTITNGGCFSSDTVAIQADALPDISNAGPNQTLCINSPSTTLAASSPSAGTGTWSVLVGAGVTVLNSTLETSGVTGLSLGNTVLQWKVSNGMCAPNASTMGIHVDNLASVAAAGNDQTLCISSSSISLTGNFPTTGSGLWIILSGSAAVTNPTLATTSLTNLGAGIIALEWKITNGGCSNSDTVFMQVDGAPDISVAGNNQTLCVSTSSASLSANTPSLGAGTWSVVSGSGSFGNPASANTSLTGFTAGVVLLQWSVSNGVCAANVSSLSIEVDQEPLPAYAGINQTICASSTTLAATAPSIGVGSWLVSSGNATVLSPTLATSEVDNINGPIVLQWVVTNGACTSNTASMNIQTANPTGAIFAGNNFTTCLSAISMSANPAPAGSGLWTLISGTAVIADTSNARTAINNLGVGNILFKWTISNGSCPKVSDTVTITREQPVDTAHISGRDTTIKVSELTLHANAPVVGTGAWELVSGYCVFSDYLNATCPASGLTTGATTLIKWKITGTCGFTEDSIKITVTDFILPNAISPNGDGKNDFFEVPDIHKYSSVELTVLNRWGSVVFEDKHYNNTWNGTNAQNTPLTEDTYFYTLKLDEASKTGFVIVKR